MMKFHPKLLFEGIVPHSPVWLGWVQSEGPTKHTLPSHPAPHTAAQTSPQDVPGRSISWQIFSFILLKTHHSVLGQCPASELGMKEEMKFKHKCNNKNQHKASLRTEREITRSEGGTLPLSYFLIPFQITFPSSSPLPGASISMQHSCKEQPSDSPTLLPSACPGTSYNQATHASYPGKQDSWKD